MLNNLVQIHLKVLQRKQFKRQQKQLVTWLVIKFLIDLLKSQEVHHRINNSEMITNEHDQEIINKIYTYIQKKDRKLLMIKK